MNNNFLVTIFGPKWAAVRSQMHKERLMYYACDVQRLIGLSNVTNSTRGVTKGLRVQSQHMAKAISNDPSVPGYVILLTLEGVFQIIFNNDSAACQKIRNLTTNRYLPKVENLKLY